MTTYYPPGNLAITEGFLLERATAALPATTTGNIFTITGGRIVVRGLVGEVTTAIQAQANAVKIVFDPTVAGSNVDLCATLDVNGLVVGTYLGITGIATDPMKSALSVMKNDLDQGMFFGPGALALTTAATNTGSVKWSLFYIPIDTGVVVAAA
ncbi:MAG: hypothetical protein ABW046_22560 [Actinoplanes sp.]